MTELPKVEAIDRALGLLTVLSRHGAAGASLATLAEEAGLNKATAYRALSTFRQRGFAIQGDDGAYALGPAAMALGEQAYGPQALAQDLHPALMALSSATHELVHLGAMEGDSVVYLDKVEPDRAIRVWSAVGRSMPVAGTSLGRALLAARDLTDAQLAAYLARQAPERRVTCERLVEIVERARVRGYASEYEENEPGVACLGTAVLQGGRPIAAISVTTMAASLTPAREDEIVATMRRVVPPLLPDGMALALKL
ncbi:IclR family transcriptional regulator [Mariniluteicoccus flavus]